MLLKSALAQRTLCVPKFIELVLVVDHDLSLSCNRTAHDLPSSLLSIFYFIYFFFTFPSLVFYLHLVVFIFSLFAFFFISLSRGRINLDLERGSIDMALMEKKKKKKKNSGVSWKRISCQELQEGIEMSRISGTVFVPHELKRELRIYLLH